MSAPAYHDATPADWNRQYAILKGATRCNCCHGCTATADGFLVTPSGKIVPGGYTRREHAAPTIREYREKLGEAWRFDAGVEHHDPTSGHVSIRPTPPE